MNIQELIDHLKQVLASGQTEIKALYYDDGIPLIEGFDVGFVEEIDGGKEGVFYMKIGD